MADPTGIMQMPSLPGSGPPAQGIGYTSGGGRAMGVFDAILGGIKQGKLAAYKRALDEAGTSYEIADRQYKGMVDAMKNSPDEKTRLAYEKALADREEAYDNLHKMQGAPKVKANQQQQKGGFWQKAGDMFRKIMTGPEYGQGAASLPTMGEYAAQANAGRPAAAPPAPMQIPQMSPDVRGSLMTSLDIGTPPQRVPAENLGLGGGGIQPNQVLNYGNKMWRVVSVEPDPVTGKPHAVLSSVY